MVIAIQQGPCCISKGLAVVYLLISSGRLMMNAKVAPGAGSPNPLIEEVCPTSSAGDPGHSYSREPLPEPVRLGLSYGQRVKLVRLLSSAAIELNAAKRITGVSMDNKLFVHVTSSHAAALEGLRRLLLDEARTLSKEDMALLDPTITKALAEL